MVFVRCLLTSFMLMCAVHAQSNSLDKIFKDPVKESCAKLEGDLQDCHECYKCDAEDVLNYQSKNNIPKMINLTYTNSENICVTETFCCLSQQVITNYRIGEVCGKKNPDGVKPRQKRLGPKDLLIGEYPWIAHVFKRGPNNVKKYICEATLTHADKGILLAPASCVQGVHATSLYVSFSKDLQKPSNTLNVEKVLIHENYTANNKNNIAMLQLTTPGDMPDWAAQVCVAEKRPIHATSNCFTITEGKYLINTIIPIRRNCGVLDDSEICSISAPGDYSPSMGSGLFCESEADTQFFTLHGLYSGDSTREVTKYVDINNFQIWIYDTTNNQKQPPQKNY